MAMFLDGLVSTVFDKLVAKAIKEISSILGVEREMKTLEIKIKKIECLLEDADSKKIETKSIHFWLAEFREVLYDTEDLLDDFQFHTEAKATSKDSTNKNWTKKAMQKCSQVLSIPSDVDFKKKIATRIEDINKTLDRLYSDSTDLRLENLPNKDHEKVCSYSRSRPTNTTSLQLDSDLVGIDDDATKLADQIITDTEQTHSAFAIIGMGGIGKSTLARKVLDLVKNEQHFDKSIWINISRNWSGAYVLKEIVKLVHGNYHKKEVSDEELSQDFIETAKDKSVFIVLDDVWHSEVWEKFLRVPLLRGAKYSRILITTRNEKVAKEMDVSKRHIMKTMLLEDGWLLLRKNVFREGDDVLNDRLEETGKKIVKSCEYIPLAIKAMAGVLKMKDKNKSASTWEDVLKSETWSTGNLPEDVKASLLLSYEDLSPQLKKCFTYFSVLPRLPTTSFYRDVIINLWTAEGFDKKGNGEYKYLSSEECYYELMMRNLIQSESVHTHTRFNMHDLVYSLALYLSEKENIYVQHSDSKIKRRHLCIHYTDLDAAPEEIKKQDYLRSLFLDLNYRLNAITPECYLVYLRRLRVLSFVETAIEKIPKEIGTLIHLKYLDLSHTQVKELPESIKNLKNLEVLRASGLSMHSLPTGITELINLKAFYVSWSNVHSMPPGMHNLKNLRYLDNFAVTTCTEGGSDSTTNIKELKGMSQLTYLVINNLERVSNKEEAEEAAMENKTNLKNLGLSWKYEDREFDGKDIEKNENVFTGIEIPINLETLEIFSFIGRRLPSHIFNANMLTVLVLSSCLYVEQLPSLGDLPELERLTIKNARSVKEIGRELFGSSKFPRLQFFEMWKMNNLEKMFEVEEGAFPCLEKLIVRECPKLKFLSKGWQHAKCLKFLLVEQVENLESVENLNSVSELKLKSNSRLTSIKNLPSLKIITVYDCLSLREVKDVAELNQLLVSVEVKDVAEQCIAPEWVRDMSPQPKKIVLQKYSPRNGLYLTQNWSDPFDFRSKH